MSDEELVKCPNNPNHQVPRSQIDEHVKTCKFFINPHHETQITLSSYDEPRPSTSYQESSQEGSSQQGGSQEATLPVPESTSFRKWRSQKETEIKETSPSKLKRLKPYLKPLKSKEISTKSVRASSKSDLSPDKQSKKGQLEMRKKTYLKILSRKRKDLKKLKIDSNSDDNSSSSTDSALSLEDTMSDNKKIILYEMGIEYKEQAPSTSQQTHSSQQAAILQPPKLTLQKKDEKMDDESSVDLSSRFSQEPSDPLEFEMEGPSSPGDVPQEQSESVSSYAKTSNDSINLQRISKKRKMEHEKMYPEEIVKVKVSHPLAEVTTPLEVESSSSEEVPLQQSLPFSFHAALSYHSDVSDQPKIISKKKRVEMDTEEKMESEESHTLSQVITQLEAKLKEPYLVEEVPLQQLKPFSFYAASASDSDNIDITNDESPQADILQQESSSLQEDNSLQDVISLQDNSSLQEDILIPRGSLLQEDSSQPEESWGEVTSDMLDYLHSKETGSSEPTSSFQEEQSESVVSHDKAKHELNVPQEERRLIKRLHESSSESTDSDDLQKEGSSQEADISSETDSSQRKKRRRYDYTSTTYEDKGEKIEFEKSSSSVPKEQSKPVVSRGKTKHQLDIPQGASKLRKRSYETSSESTDIDIGDLQEAGSSLKSDISPKAYVSPRKKKFLEKRRRYDSSSSTDEDKDEKKGI